MGVKIPRATNTALRGGGLLGAPSVNTKVEENSDNIYKVSVSGGGLEAEVAVSGKMAGVGSGEAN